MDHCGAREFQDAERLCLKVVALDRQREPVIVNVRSWR
jgi:hypothetical protein